MIQIEFGDGSIREYQVVRATPSEVAFDVSSYRGAGGDRWSAAGSGDTQGVAMELRFDVQPPDPTVTFDGQPVEYEGDTVTFVVVVVDRLERIVSDLRSGLLLRTPHGVWRLAGVQSVVEQPQALGYITRVNVALLEPRFPSFASVLRLLSGRVLELR